MQRTVRGNPGVKPYDPLDGVPKGWYYLEEMVGESVWAIRFVAKTKKALVELCRKRRWRLTPSYGWTAWIIERRGANASR